MDQAFEAALVERVQRGEVHVPAYPRAASQLSQTLGAPDFSLDEVLRVLRVDDVLAATALRVANSPFYARGEPVTTLSAAVMRIGSKELHRLVLASGLGKAFNRPGPLAALRRRTWRQSLLSAVICERLAMLARESAEESFVAGLLHDVGKVLTITVIEELLVDRPFVLQSDDQWWQVVERYHVELGMVLAARWKLPEALEAIISDHHLDVADPAGVLRRVQASDEVVQLLETEVSLSEQTLGTVALLTTPECQTLADSIPHLPEFIEAFAPESPAVESAAAARPLPVVANTGAALPVTLVAAGSTLTGELVVHSPIDFVVRTATEGRPNWLVQVKLAEPELTFWANVKSSESAPDGRHDWTMKPFALASQPARQWAELSRALAKVA